ncbi:uncharacterized protein LOC119738111 [Patiria miniata]|uniref:Glycosyltransferase 2-like domain-containing protein n=1 Tax=Patiria miniata TaxID=46514 RepID=A0A914AXB7_PATMI|nr:uncharacterized protein LOC119738111 [Patiria miniata]
MWLILLLICFLVIFATLWYLRVVSKTSSKERIVILCKFPRPGGVKTRLIPGLGEAGAARAQLYMSDHMLDVLSEFQRQRVGITVEVKAFGGSADQFKYWLGRKLFPRQCFSWSFQCDGHLGIKMADALNSAFNEGSEFAVLIGSDTPAVNADILETALSKLRSPDCEMILGRAQDGGYYLVGFRRQVKERLGVLNDIFEGIEWSTSTVCHRQAEIATGLGVKVQLMPQILQDVDTPDDLPEFEKSVGVSVTALKAPVLSIVIPTLNEEENIERALRSIKENSSWIDYIEVIISDGGSTDSTLGKVDEFAQNNPELRIKTVRGGRGRGKQLNAGASEATGVNLLFLHADGSLPLAFDRHILLTLAEPGNIAGAFNLGWDVLQGDKRNDCSRLISAQLQLGQLLHLACYKFTETAYGDQGMFMSRKIFEKVGHFPPYRLMEDYEMALKLQRYGHLKILQEVFIIASARRLIKKGVWKARFINCLMVMGYHMGIHPDTLANFYYG